MSKIPKLRFKEFSGEFKSYKLGYLTDVKSASRVFKEQWITSGVPFFRTSDVVSEFKGLRNIKAYISMELFEELSKKSGRTKKNDILITGGGSIGIPYLIKNNEPLYFKDADLIWLKDTNQLSGLYLYLFFSTLIFKKYLNSIAHIGTISHYTIEQVKATPIKIPQYQEQVKIASFLTSVDTKIEQLNKKQQLLEEYKKGIIQKIFSQEIRFKNDDSGEFLDWEVKRLKELFKFLRGSSLSKSDIVNNGKNKCIHYGELFTKYNEKIFSVKSTTNLENGQFSKNGDILMPSSDVTPQGLATASALIEDNVIIGGDTNILRPINEINSIFISYFLNTNKNEIMKLVTGTTIKHIYNKDIEKLKINLPQLKEQTKIANFLSSIDKKIEFVSNQLAQTKEFKKALLQMMFV